MALDIKSINAQLDFCSELMVRLSAEMKSSVDDDAWQGMWNYTQKKSDIIRLRRELNKLNQMLDPYRG